MPSVVGKIIYKLVLILLAWAFCNTLPIQATDLPTETLKERVIQRSNFGALFYAQYPVTVFSEHYFHHLVFQLPHKSIRSQLKAMREFTEDLGSTSQNISSNPLHYIISQLVNTQTNHIASLLDTVYSLIPEVIYQPEQMRVKPYALFALSYINFFTA
jgi:hypothetical protein